MKPTKSYECDVCGHPVPREEAFPSLSKFDGVYCQRCSRDIEQDSYEELHPTRLEVESSRRWK